MADKLTETVERLRELLAKATPGRWEACERGEYSDYDGDSRVILGDDMRVAVVQTDGRQETEANANLVVEAVNALPDLLAALSRPNVDEMREALPMSDDVKVIYKPVLVYFKRHGWLRVEWGSSYLDDGEITPENGIWMVDDFKHGPYAVRGYCDGDDTHYMPLPAPPAALRGSADNG